MINFTHLTTGKKRPRSESSSRATPPPLSLTSPCCESKKDRQNDTEQHFQDCSSDLDTLPATQPNEDPAPKFIYVEPRHLPAGFLLGDYCLEYQINMGSFGAIYRAHHTSDPTQQEVAIKVALSEHAWQFLEVEQQFAVSCCMGVDRPWMPHYYDSGVLHIPTCSSQGVKESVSVAWFAMELLGPNLFDVAGCKELQEREACALAAAHDHHNRAKPCDSQELPLTAPCDVDARYASPGVYTTATQQQKAAAGIMENANTNLTTYISNKQRKQDQEKQHKLELFAPFFHGMLDAVEAMHEVGYIHRDIKPENFCIRSSMSPAPDQVVLVDYGFAFAYLTDSFLLDTPASPKTSRSSSDEGARAAGSSSISNTSPYYLFFGSRYYASINALEGRNPVGPADDLESLAYSFLDMLNNGLPWCNELKDTAEGHKTKWDEALLKADYSYAGQWEVEDVLFGIPVWIERWVDACREMNRDVVPDYSKFRKLIDDATASEAFYSQPEQAEE